MHAPTNIELKSESLVGRLKEAAEIYGSPAYIYDADVIRKSYRSLKNSVGDNVDIYYSIKANPNISICAFLRSLGAKTEVCSTAEFYTVLKAGFKPSEIIFVGPHKKQKDIQLCIEHEIFAVVCESFEEIETINDLAESNDKRVNLLLRINPEFSAKSALLKMGGKPSQFGIDEPQAPKALKQILASQNLNLLGIHIYNGTRILNAETIIENTSHVLEYASKLQQDLGVTFQVVDFGGGAGVPYFPNEKKLDMDVLEHGLRPIIAKYLTKYPQTKLIMESGRYLVGPSGRLVLQAHSIKMSKGEKFIVADGGTNCHMAAVGIGSIVRNNFPIELLKDSSGPATETYNITGPLCTPNDLVAKKVTLPEVKVGDYLAVCQSGAYGPTASPVFFLSHGFPNEVLIDGSNAFLIRKADQTEDLLRNQLLVKTTKEK